MDVLRNQLHRVLEIRYHLDHAVSRDLKHPVIRGVKLPEIPCIKDRLNLRILITQLSD